MPAGAGCPHAHPLEECPPFPLPLSALPSQARAGEGAVARGLAKELPPDIDLDTHFKPRYEPWDQRLCLVPDGDLFRAIRAGRASVVTDEVVRFTEHGIQLKSGRELPADVIVTATGLNLLAWGGIRLEVDGTALEPGQCVTYKGLMLSNVPNFAVCAGYANASWTLRGAVGGVCLSAARLHGTSGLHAVRPAV